MKNRVHPPIEASELTEELAALKAENEGLSLYQSQVTLPKGQGSISIVWREPTYEDAEMLIAKQGDDPAAANANLVMTLAVGPASKAAAGELARWPFALSRWVDREVMPFFGAKPQLATRSL